MFVAYVCAALVTIAANTVIVIADLSRAKFVLANSAEVGVPESWHRYLAALKAAGALGLLAGLLGTRYVGIAAAAGLTLFYIGALITHIRARVFHNIAFPGGFFALAVTSLALAVAQ
ncbi:DoxX family protein [Spirillospora sp. CA-294931]|uniref:DoxX family protein n=1 Tax=Spirillospora sp. CA-294931 TaxID=3240042 RepID=UPI003D8CB154